jgi:hypothetical protein
LAFHIEMARKYCFDQLSANGDRSELRNVSMGNPTHRSAAYDRVIKDLYAKRDQLNRAIEALEALVDSDGLAAKLDAPLPLAERTRIESREPQMSLIDSIKAVLSRSDRPLGNAEILQRLIDLGIVFRSANPQLSVSQVLSRNFKMFGEPMRVGRGKWVLGS